MRRILRLCLWVLGISHAIRAQDAGPSISASQDLYYDRSPKLRIRSSGFKGGDHQIKLAFSPELIEGRHYTLDLLNQDSGQVIMLKLLANRKWAETSGKSKAVLLHVISAKDESLGGTELIADGVAVQVAGIISTPEVEDSSQTIYQTATAMLYINGTFNTAKQAKLYFSPPLLVEIDYEVKVIRPKFIALSLRPNAQWAEFPGPLYLKGIDTGAGPLKIGGDDGILVATVQADLDKHGVTVDSNENLKMYQNSPTLTIAGSGFDSSPSGNTLRFANGILGEGFNYTITAASKTQLTLTLSASSVWRKNGYNLPGPLTLLAVDVGVGYVPVGATNAKKGRIVATIYETPEVYSSNTKLFRTQNHELRLTGKGFPVSEPSGLIIEFDPTLVVNLDYTLQIVDRTQLAVILKDGRAWGPAGSNLKVTKISSMGKDFVVPLPNGGVHVAMIMDDVNSEDTGGVTINPTSQRVYQTLLSRTIDVQGSGFKDGISLTLDPPIILNEDYNLVVKSTTLMKLTLVGGKKWAPQAGNLRIMSWTLEGKEHLAAYGAGIRVAIVYADPVVLPGEGLLHVSQSKALVIYGSGFSDQEVKIELEPTPLSSFKVSWAMEDVIRLLLLEGKTWISSSLDQSSVDSKLPLKVVAIDTGAGRVSISGGVVVAYLIADRDGVTCDDSCEFAFDGVCDDQSASMADQGYGSGLDDDYGGVYDDYTGGGRKSPRGGYDDYYLDDQYTVSACLAGTDCTDCGGVDAMSTQSTEDCTNTCKYARDGTCDDPRGGNYCPLGTDCEDCGPATKANFTQHEDDMWWDDEDDYWDMNDNTFLDQVKGLEHNRNKIKPRTMQPVSESEVFVTMLEAIVYSTGAVIAVFGAWMAYKYYNGERLPFLDAFTPSMEVEMHNTRKEFITPDVVRT